MSVVFRVMLVSEDEKVEVHKSGVVETLLGSGIGWSLIMYDDVVRCSFLAVFQGEDQLWTFVSPATNIPLAQFAGT